MAVLLLADQVIGSHEAYAQAPEYCRPVETSTFSKLMKALGPISGAVPVLSLAIQGKWMTWDFAAAVGTEIASIYNTWFKDQPTAYDCTIPRTLVGAGPGGSLRLLATDDAIQRVTDSSGQINYQLLNRTIQQEYAKLGPLTPGGGPEAGQVPRYGEPFAGPRLPPTDSTRVRGVVEDAKGGRLEGIAIQIRPAFNRDFWTTVLTDQGGEFGLVEPPGSYVIYAHANGFSDSDVSVVKRAYRDSTVTIQLRREAVQLGPSFDCSRAASRVDLLICQDGGLAAAERAMASAYSAALGGRLGTDRANLRADQEQWYQDYAATCNALQGDELRQCVLDYLTRRTEQLRVLR